MTVSSRHSDAKSSTFQVLGNTMTSGRNARVGSSIEVADIIASGERCSQKIGTTFIPQFNKPMANTFQKDAGKRDFVNAIQRANSTKLGPNHYKIFDAGGFIDKDNLKKVKFAFSKDQKKSVIDQMAKK